jgi:hypothetical protein
LGLTAGPAAAQNFVINGSFVTNTGVAGGIARNFVEVSGWYSNHVTAVFAYLPDGAGPYSGPFYGYQDALYTKYNAYSGSQNTWDGSGPGGSDYAVILSGAGGVLKQDLLGLTTGTTYRLSFSWALAATIRDTGAETGYLSATLGGTTLSTSTASMPAYGFSGWMNQSFDFVAGSPAQTLGFSANGSNPSGSAALLVTGVSLQVATEPASLALLSGALCVLFAVRRGQSFHRSVR